MDSAPLLGHMGGGAQIVSLMIIFGVGGGSCSGLRCISAMKWDVGRFCGPFQTIIKISIMGDVDLHLVFKLPFQWLVY